MASCSLVLLVLSGGDRKRCIAEEMAKTASGFYPTWVGVGGGGAWMWPIVHLSMSVIIRGQTLWTSEDHVTMSLQGLLVPRGTDWNPSFAANGTIRGVLTHSAQQTDGTVGCCIMQAMKA